VATGLKVHWRDLVIAAASLWLMGSPFLFGYDSQLVAATNAYGVGCALIFFCIMSAWRLRDFGNEIVNIVFGCWLVLSPYALAFADQRAATLNAIAVGLCVIVLGIWDLAAASKSGQPG